MGRPGLNTASLVSYRKLQIGIRNIENPYREQVGIKSQPTVATSTIIINYLTNISSQHRKLSHCTDYVNFHVLLSCLSKKCCTGKALLQALYIAHSGQCNMFLQVVQYRDQLLPGPLSTPYFEKSFRNCIIE
jgi:hypothetical protein